MGNTGSSTSNTSVPTPQRSLTPHPSDPIPINTSKSQPRTIVPNSPAKPLPPRHHPFSQQLNSHTLNLNTNSTPDLTLHHNHKNTNDTLIEKSYQNNSHITFTPGLDALAPIITADVLDLQDEPHDPGLVPVILNWTHGGKNVYVTGSFNSWKKKQRLYKSQVDFSTVINLPPGKHTIKFIVDDEWKCSDDLETVTDDEGNLVNQISIAGDRMQHDGLDGLDLLVSAPIHVSESPPNQVYSQVIPTYLSTKPIQTDQPPDIPPHLEKVGYYYFH